jgi:hypothetical protein
MAYKRLSAGKFRWWPAAQAASELESHELAVLLAAGDPRSTQAAPPWRSVRTGSVEKSE